MQPPGSQIVKNNYDQENRRIPGSNSGGKILKFQRNPEAGKVMRRNDSSDRILSNAGKHMMSQGGGSSLAA